LLTRNDASFEEMRVMIAITLVVELEIISPQNF
jgi:hypothetical protein